MQISFLDFWDGFQPNNNFLYYLVKNAVQNEITITNPENADIIMFSCFGQEHNKYSHKKRIFYTGENVRPNFNECDFSLSFDFDTYNGKNIRLPLWLYYIDFFNVRSYGNPEYLIPLNEIEQNKWKRVQKEDFCSIMVNNFNTQRQQIYHLINSYKFVKGYGRAFNNWSQGEEDKLDKIAKGKFHICLENSSYPGYYTEKPLHAKVANTIPIYYSDPRYNEDFSEKGFINIINFSNNVDLLNYIKQVDMSNELTELYLNTPLFNCDILSVLSEIKEKLKKILCA